MFNEKLDKGLILCILISICCAFMVGFGIGAKSEKSHIEKVSVKEGRAYIDDAGEFVWKVLTDDD